MWSPIIGTRVLVDILFRLISEKTSKVGDYWPFLMRFHRSMVDSPRKGPALRHSVRHMKIHWLWPEYFFSYLSKPYCSCGDGWEQFLCFIFKPLKMTPIHIYIHMYMYTHLCGCECVGMGVRAQVCVSVWVPSSNIYIWNKTIFRFMMTSSNGNIFRVTGHLCGEFIGHRWIRRTKASDAELWCFLWSVPE